MKTHKHRHANASVAVVDFRQVEFHSFKAWDTTSPVTIYNFKFSAIFLVNNYHIMVFMNKSLCPVRLKTFTRQMYEEQHENSTQYTNHKISSTKVQETLSVRQVTSTHLFTCRGLLFKHLTPPLLSCLQLLIYIENCWPQCTLLTKLLASSIPSWAVCKFCSTLKIVGSNLHALALQPTNSMYAA